MNLWPMCIAKLEVSNGYQNRTIGSKPANYAYVNVYRKDGRLIGGRVSNSRKEADLCAVSTRVGCLKVKLEERFDD